MTIGTADFARFALRGFGRLSAEINTLQERISSGVNDPRVSADPARASGLSALTEIRARLGRQSAAAEGATSRLDLTDQVLTGVSANLRDLHQIALRAANDTLPPETQAVFATEARVLRASLLSAANAVDLTGRPLFAGTAPGPAYAETAGGLHYGGNDTAPVAQVGDRLVLPAGLTGAAVFGTGQDGIFAAVDRMIASLTEPMLSARTTAMADGQARLDLTRSRAEASLTLTMTGPVGTAAVVLDLRADNPAGPAAAINALSDQTGITATMEDDGRGIRLVASGKITLSGVEGDTDPKVPVVRLQPLGADGSISGSEVALRPADLTPNALVAETATAVDKAAKALAAAGSLGAAVERQANALADRKLTVEQSVSQLRDLDVAAALTRLQGLLLSEQASQQTFVKITSQSLFDYIR